jgi:large subunit ribosomal protein L22
MEKQYSPSKIDKKVSAKQLDSSQKIETPKVEQKIEEKKENKSSEKVEKKEEKKKVEIKKKDFAFANGVSLRISPKFSSEVCKVIRGRSPEAAIVRLEEALKGKRAIPMKGREVPHQKGKGMAGGRFPKNVCESFIALIKQAAANANHVGLENHVIFLAYANKATSPYRAGGRRGKRAHVYIEIRDKTKLNVKNQKS